MKIIFIISISCNLLFSNVARKNFEIIDSLANQTFLETLEKIRKKNIDSFIPVFNDSPEYFKAIFISKMHELDFDLSGDSLKINFLKYKPNYVLNDDSIGRNIEFYLACNSLQIYTRKYYEDEFSKASLNYIENSEFQFDKAILPPEKQSFFKKYLEPIIVIGSTLVTVLLLFTVRSS